MSNEKLSLRATYDQGGRALEDILQCLLRQALLSSTTGTLDTPPPAVLQSSTQSK